MTDGSLSQTWHRGRLALLFLLSAVIADCAPSPVLQRRVLTHEEAMATLGVGNQDLRKCSESLALDDCSQAIVSGRLSHQDLAKAFNYRGFAYFSRKEFDSAIEDYGQAIALNPKFADAFFNRGNAYGVQRDFDHAIEDYGQAIRLHPKYVEALTLRCLAFTGRREFDRAIRDCTQAIQLNPLNSPAMTIRGSVYAAKKDPDRAIQDFDRALQLQPHNPAAHVGRGLVYADDGDYERALQDLDRAVEQGPLHAEFWARRGAVYTHKGEYERARRDFDSALKLDSKHAGTFLFRGTLESFGGNYERALSDYQTAGKIDPKIPWQKHMALLFFNMGRLGDSTHATEEWVKTMPEDPYAVIWRYVVRGRNGEAPTAIRELGDSAAGFSESGWPGTLIQFLLGKITEAEMYVAAETPPRRKVQQLCEATFYAAEAKLLSGNAKDATPMLQAAARDCPSGYVEKHAARGELKRLGL